MTGSNSPLSARSLASLKDLLATCKAVKVIPFAVLSSNLSMVYPPISRPVRSVPQEAGLLFMPLTGRPTSFAWRHNSRRALGPRCARARVLLDRASKLLIQPICSACWSLLRPPAFWRAASKGPWDSSYRCLLRSSTVDSGDCAAAGEERVEACDDCFDAARCQRGCGLVVSWVATPARSG